MPARQPKIALPSHEQQFHVRSEPYLLGRQATGSGEAFRCPESVYRGLCSPAGGPARATGRVHCLGAGPRRTGCRGLPSPAAGTPTAGLLADFEGRLPPGSPRAAGAKTPPGREGRQFAADRRNGVLPRAGRVRLSVGAGPARIGRPTGGCESGAPHAPPAPNFTAWPSS